MILPDTAGRLTSDRTASPDPSGGPRYQMTNVSTTASGIGLLAAAGAVAALGAGPLLVERRRPPRRPDRQGRPPHRHHRPLRVQVDGRDDPRPERQPAHEPGRHQVRAASTRARSTSSTSTRNVDGLRRHRLPRSSSATPARLETARSSRTTPSSERPAPSARTNAWTGARSSPSARRPPTAASIRDRPASSAAARPSPARVTTPSSSTSRASSSSRSSCSPARPTWASCSVGSPGSTRSRAPTSARSPSKSRTRASAAPAQTIGVWATTSLQAGGGYQPGRADGPPGDQHRVQQHATPRRKPPTGSARPTTAPSTRTTSSASSTRSATSSTRTRCRLHAPPRRSAIAERPPAGHPDGQARRRRRVPQRPPAGGRRHRRRVRAPDQRERHERRRQRQRQDVPGHVPVPRQAALSDRSAGPATGRPRGPPPPSTDPTDHRDARSDDSLAEPPRRACPRIPLAILLLTIAGRDRRPGRRRPAARPHVAIPGGRGRGPPADRRRRPARPARSTRSRRPARAVTSADLERIRADIDVLGRPASAETRATSSARPGWPPPRSSWPARPATSAPTSPPNAAIDGALAAYPDYAARARLPRRHPGRPPPLRGRARPRDGRSWPTSRTTRPRSRRSATPRSSSATWPPPTTAYTDARRRRRFGRGAGPREPPRVHRGPDRRRGRGLAGRARRGQGRGRRRQRPGLVPLPARRHAHRHRRPRRAPPRPTPPPSPPTRRRTSPTGAWPGSPRPTAGLDEAIAQLDAAIAIVPLPEFLARRADLYALRGAAGDAEREADDRKTVLAIAQLAGDAAGVYDRTLSLYLAEHRRRSGPRPDPRPGRDRGPQGRLRLRCARLGAARQRPPGGGRRRDDHGPRVRDPRREAAVPRRDDRGRPRRRRGRARTLLTDALALDASFDPLGARSARATLARLP